MCVFVHVCVYVLLIMSSVLGLLRGACTCMYITRYAKQSFFCIVVKFDCFATLHKTLSVWAEALKA